MSLILSYGMLANNRVMDSDAGRLGPAVLHGFRWEMLQFANCTECPGKSFQGILWEIDDRILRVLDSREGFPHFYNRLEVTVVHDDMEKQAWVYSMTPTARESMLGSMPSDYYLDTVAEGYSEDNIFPPEGYHGDDQS